ncbi:hypothetical protein LEP1GSC046_1769 [Leptospira kirschneri serovar Bim str. 1051]|uniref:hypothetical protein n=1 Tax=Leptospira kirschneri TaxID=29507 RepID=UPI00028842D7|nr:hypothetical protein [Leptospira kirschneri]EMK18471.1 hypothetical protein LEP1GSC042_0875 [Leptospira kirschneri serovar Bim str. PUO 1247]EMN03629.1 hypothetical protein LEP1GSC046_1769 [Leptospira kirschneri serovar Bim str. 1051]
MKFVYSLFVLFILGLSGSVWGQADPYPISDCIGKDGNPELYKIPKMKEGDVIKGIWYDIFSGTPGDAVDWASSFFKAPYISKNLKPKPKDFEKLKEWAKETCGYYSPYGVQYNEQDVACFDLSKNKGVGEVVLSPITLEEKNIYFQSAIISEKRPINVKFQRISFPKKVRFYFLIPEELTGGPRGGKIFTNLKLVSSQEAEIPFASGYLKVPIQSYDKIKSQFKVDRKKIYHENIIVATEILEIYESKGTPGEIGRTCIDEISNTLGEKYYQKELMKP